MTVATFWTILFQSKKRDHFLNASLSEEDSLQVPFPSLTSSLPSDRFILIMRFNEQLQNYSKVKFERKQSGCTYIKSTY